MSIFLKDFFSISNENAFNNIQLLLTVKAKIIFRLCLLNHGQYLCVLGRRGVFTGVSGLQIAYVSGSEAQQEPPPSYCFSPKDLTALATPLLSNSKFKGVDILLTSQWPRGVWQYGNTPASTLLESVLNCIKQIHAI